MPPCEWATGQSSEAHFASREYWWRRVRSGRCPKNRRRLIKTSTRWSAHARAPDCLGPWRGCVRSASSKAEPSHVENDSGQPVSGRAPHLEAVPGHRLDHGTHLGRAATEFRSLSEPNGACFGDAFDCERVQREALDLGFEQQLFQPGHHQLFDAIGAHLNGHILLTRDPTAGSCETREHARRRSRETALDRTRPHLDRSVGGVLYEAHADRWPVGKHARTLYSMFTQH